MPSITQSIEKLRKRLDKDPNSLIFSQLAEEHRKDGDLQEALRILKGGLTRHPNYWSARVTLGRVYQQMGDTPSAVQELEKVVQSAPDNLMANRLLGDIYSGMQLPGEALKRYRMVHMMNPKDEELKAQIRRLESEVVEPEPSPPQLDTLVETRIEPEEPEPADVEPEVEPEVPSNMDERQEEGYAPTIQMKIPDFLETTEITMPPVETSPLVEIIEKVNEVSMEPDSTLSDRQIDDRIEPPLDQQPPPAEDLFASDTLILDLPDSFEEEGFKPPVDDPLKEVSDSDQLTSLASLLLSTEQTSVDQRDFDELESEIEEESDLPVEEFMRDPQQDRTQPIEGENETDEADELTSETLAELYMNQGLMDKAVKVYQRLLMNDPGNKKILQRLRELNAEDSTPLQVEAFQQEDIFIMEQQLVQIETSENTHEARRTAERKRKISTLENWLTTIRRERD